MSNSLLDEAIAKINEAKTFMATEHLIELESEAHVRLGMVLELAQGHTDEEISHNLADRLPLTAVSRRALQDWEDDQHRVPPTRFDL